MKVFVTIKQKNLTTSEEQTLCESVCEMTQTKESFEFTYHEEKPYDGTVKISGNSFSCQIHRTAENTSILKFSSQQKTKGRIQSAYGEFEVDIYTHVYHKKENILAIEYDILNGSEVLEKFRMMAKFKKLV